MNTPPIDSSTSQVANFSLEPTDNARLSNLCGPLDQHLRQIEGRLNVDIQNRGHDFLVTGDPHQVRVVRQLLEKLYIATESEPLSPQKIHLHLQQAQLDTLADKKADEVGVRTRRTTIKARGENQSCYLNALRRHDVSFGIGPAGTGKTYLAVACAVEALDSERVKRLILVRPAVEAGERLGFLPGDLAQKVDPYLRPLYDALYEMCGFERVMKLIERNIIEIAPLAYMRGRTLNEAFIILDEAQNTSVEQMKMFLTRIGFGATAVITGDVTQIDLPRGQRSGLLHAIKVLESVSEISFTYFTSRDVLRHPLIGRILDAYEVYEHQQDDSP